MSKDTIEVHTLIIGAGAAGLFCAMQAGEAFKGTNKKIHVIDHANKAGKKILMSGGGKCNFTNYSIESENYISSNPHFCKSALSRYTNWDFIALIEKNHIAYEERKHGQLFCLNSAKDILTMLLTACQQFNVPVTCNRSVKSIRATKENKFVVTTHVVNKSASKKNSNQNQTIKPPSNNQTFVCDKLVIATGGLSIPTMGATGFGYEVASQFGHKLLPRRAGLVPFTFTDRIGDMTKHLAGNAIEVTANNQKNSMAFTEAMLFTHRGLSGPAMLQISNYWQPSEYIYIDLRPAVDMAAWLLTQKKQHPKSIIRVLLQAHFPKKVVAALQQQLWHAVAEKPIADIANDTLITLGNQLNNWQIKPSGTEGYRTAEVTLGGVCVDEVSSKTMESKLQPNLYFIGEVLDVTGWLGGYNFQWAWSCADACAQALYKS